LDDLSLGEVKYHYQVYKYLKQVNASW